MNNYKRILRDIFYIVILLAACISLDAQELNKNALMVKTQSEAKGLKFYNEIKTFAEKDWKGNHEMMIFTINKQADAIVDFISATSSENYDINIMAVALDDWKDKNGICDYVMIMYQYKKQLKAKGNY
jgi:hypothetical protein